MKRYDLVVIGGGSAGSSAAKSAAQASHRVALIERHRLGGTCLNYGCDPTKTLLESARIFHDARHSAGRGLRIEEARVEWPAVRRHVEEVQAIFRGGSDEEGAQRQRERGIDLHFGEASFEDAHTIAVGDKRLEAERVLLAIGYEAAIPPIDGLPGIDYLTNKTLFSIEALPARLAIIGAGAVGVEFAQMFQRFGVAVTLFEMAPHILPDDDAQLANELADCLAEEGVRIHSGVTIERVEQEKDTKRIHYRVDDSGGDTRCAEVDAVLVAAGRKAPVAALKPERAGLAVEDGRLQVDETLRTSVPHIWAAGDVTGRYPFTHVAGAQAALALKNMFQPDAPEPFNYTAIPFVTYTEPALGHVGKTEAELRAAGEDFEVRGLSFEKVPRAIVLGRRVGRIKLLVGRDDRLLGAHVLATRGDEVIAPLVLAMRHGLTAAQLADTILPYPTQAQAVAWAAKRRDA